MVLAKQYESQLDEVEPFYGTKYKVKKIQESTLQVNRDTQLFLIAERKLSVVSEFHDVSWPLE